MSAQDNLSPKQFTLYHGSHPRNRESISTQGLVPQPVQQEGMLGDSVSHAIFLTPNKTEAKEYGSDTYQVDVSPKRLIKVDGLKGYHYASTNAIPAKKVKRL
jgi:hypothetical protein